jgi:hypothetical protein
MLAGRDWDRMVDEVLASIEADIERRGALHRRFASTLVLCRRLDVAGMGEMELRRRLREMIVREME